jgi:hypothetical protein
MPFSYPVTTKSAPVMTHTPRSKQSETALPGTSTPAPFALLFDLLESLIGALPDEERRAIEYTVRTPLDDAALAAAVNCTVEAIPVLRVRSLASVLTGFEKVTKTELTPQQAKLLLMRAHFKWHVMEQGAPPALPPFRNLCEQLDNLALHAVALLRSGLLAKSAPNRTFEVSTITEAGYGAFAPLTPLSATAEMIARLVHSFRRMLWGFSPVGSLSLAGLKTNRHNLTYQPAQDQNARAAEELLRQGRSTRWTKWPYSFELRFDPRAEGFTVFNLRYRMEEVTIPYSIVLTDSSNQVLFRASSDLRREIPIGCEHMVRMLDAGGSFAIELMVSL